MASDVPAMPADQVDHGAIQLLVTRYLQDLDRHVDELFEQMRSQIIEYEAVPEEDVKASSRAIVHAVMETVATAGGVDAASVAPLGALARQRAEQGFPPEALTRSIQLSARHVLRGFDQLALDEGVDAYTILWAHDIGWQFATEAANVIAAINHDIAVDVGQRENAHRADYLRAVLRGALPPEQIKAQARVYGLDLTIPYHALRAKPHDRKEEDRLSLMIRRTGATPSHSPVIAVSDGDLVALTPKRPVLEDPVHIAIGPALPLTEAAVSFRAATMALDTARSFGRTGVMGLEDLGALPLVLIGDDLVDIMESHHLRRLDAEPDGAIDVQLTVWTWLHYDQNVDDVASDMHIHRNTVRYRLNRFRELTDLDLRKTNDLFLASWLLYRRRIAGSF